MQQSLAPCVALLASGLLISDRGSAQSWSRTPTPRSLQLGAMAYDERRERIVAFGGHGETGEWDGNRWTLRSPANAPPVRRSHVLVYDAARGCTVLFGGALTSPAPLLDDQWEWDGVDWRQVSPSPRPAGRMRAAAAFDAARGQLVLFGGYTGPGQPTNETWLWDGRRWTQASPTASPAPQAAYFMCYDEVRARVVFHGRLDETWEWDGNNWSLRGPGPNAEGPLVFDRRRGRTVLVGGTERNTAGVLVQQTHE